MAGNKPNEDAPIVIIGSGISGICQAISLIRINKTRNFLILEKSDNVGGTWNENSYPGCCIDAGSHLYALSFEPNDWTSQYPPRAEVFAYLTRLVLKYKLLPQIKFNTKVSSATWSSASSQWDILTSRGEVIKSKFLISAIGQLNIPRIPSIPGLTAFSGKVMHTATWDATTNISGKKIALIGNGASGVQLLPSLQQLAANVTCFQRSAAYIIPRNDVKFSRLQRFAFQYIPQTRQRFRANILKQQEQAHAMVVSNEASEWVKGWSLGHMRSQIGSNTELCESLTPDYAAGCKRVVLSDEYFPALNQPNVFLETAPIQTVTEKGILVANERAEKDFDIIVLATGFQATEFLNGIEITGLNGKTLQEIWKDGPSAYLGVSVESLPNFALLYGPNTNLSHAPITLMVEAQSRYICSLLSAILPTRKGTGTGAKKPSVLFPKPEIVTEYNDTLQARLQKTTFADPRCKSWYKRADGLITNNWPGTATEYVERLSVLNWDDYSVVDGRSGTRKVERVSDEGMLLELVLTGILTVGGAIVGILWWGK